MADPKPRRLRAILNALGLICFVLAAVALVAFLNDLPGMMAPPGVWTHFGIPAGLFILSWVLQGIARRYG